MGMEEGLDGGNFPNLTIDEKYSLALKSREILFHNASFYLTRYFINGVDGKDGWYINDSAKLKVAQKLAHSSLKFPYAPKSIRNSLTVAMQARLDWLLKDDNRTTNYKSISKIKFTKCLNLHDPESNTAMIDYYPLPNQDLFPYTYPPLFTDRITYERHYNTLNNAINNRYRILENAYNTYPMKVSVSYAGIKYGKFKLEDFYVALGFEFTTHNTGKVNSFISSSIKPSKKGRDFLRGERKKENGDIQVVILTPFFGQGQISNNDIDVISTWI